MAGARAAVTSFLNVDLDIRGDACDIEECLKPIEGSVIVLRRIGKDASVELAETYPSLEETILSWIDLVGTFSPDVRNIWDRLTLRSLNVGILAPSEPYSASFPISAKAVALTATLGFEIVFTVYAPRAD
jgi:hypothetical protein